MKFGLIFRVNCSLRIFENSILRRIFGSRGKALHTYIHTYIHTYTHALERTHTLHYITLHESKASQKDYIPFHVMWEHSHE
jgi:hypothetical protein